MKTRRWILGFLGSLITGATGCRAAPAQQKITGPHILSVGKVIWDAEKLTLEWESSLRPADTKERPPFTKYFINFPACMMQVGEEKRFFTKEEAKAVSLMFMQVINGYAAESVLWWTKGYGAATPDEVTPQDMPPPPNRRIA